MMLDRIVEHKKAEVRRKQSRGYLSELKAKIRDRGAPMGFTVALEATRTPESPALIAEVKKASPSLGILREEFKDTFEPVEAAEARTVEDLRIVLKEGAPLQLLAQTLAALPKANPGEARPLRLVLKLKDGREIELAANILVSASPAARAAMKAVKGVERVI